MKDKKWMRKALSFLLAVFMVTGSMGTVLTAAAEEPETPPAETVEVVPTEAPEATDIPEVTGIPEATDVPKVTEIPEATDVPKVTEIPEATDVPEVTEAPEATDVPEVTEAPETTDVPEVTEAPETTDVPEATDVPEVTEAPEATEAPEIVDEAAVDYSRSVLDNEFFDSGFAATFSSAQLYLNPTGDELVGRVTGVVYVTHRPQKGQLNERISVCVYDQTAGVAYGYLAADAVHPVPEEGIENQRHTGVFASGVEMPCALLVLAAATEEPVPTPAPTPVPTEEPAVVPTEEPAVEPTEEPVVVPTEEPVVVPTEEPASTPAPTDVPDDLENIDRADVIIPGKPTFEMDKATAELGENITFTIHTKNATKILMYIDGSVNRYIYDVPTDTSTLTMFFSSMGSNGGKRTIAFQAYNGNTPGEKSAEQTITLTKPPVKPQVTVKNIDKMNVGLDENITFTLSIKNATKVLMYIDGSVNRRFEDITPDMTEYTFTMSFPSLGSNGGKFAIAFQAYNGTTAGEKTSELVVTVANESPNKPTVTSWSADKSTVDLNEIITFTINTKNTTKMRVYIDGKLNRYIYDVKDGATTFQMSFSTLGSNGGVRTVAFQPYNGNTPGAMSDTKTITISVANKPEVELLKISNPNVTLGENITFTLSVKNATKVLMYIDGSVNRRFEDITPDMTEYTFTMSFSSLGSNGGKRAIAFQAYNGTTAGEKTSERVVTVANESPNKPTVTSWTPDKYTVDLNETITFTINTKNTTKMRVYIDGKLNRYIYDVKDGATTFQMSFSTLGSNGGVRTVAFQPYNGNTPGAMSDTKTITISVANKPQVELLKISNPNATLGENITFTLRIKNATKVLMYIDGSVNRRFENITPDMSEYTFTMAFSSLGNNGGKRTIAFQAYNGAVGGDKTTATTISLTSGSPAAPVIADVKIDKTTAVLGEQIKFTVYLDNATKLLMYVDGQVNRRFEDVTTSMSKYEFTMSFSSLGNNGGVRTIQFQPYNGTTAGEKFKAYTITLTTTVVNKPEVVNFTMNPSRVKLNVPLTFTVNTKNATKVVLYVDGKANTSYPTTGDVTVIERAFASLGSGNGVRTIQFKPYYGTTAGELSPAQSLTLYVTDDPLTVTVPAAKQGEDLTVTWTAAGGATKYQLLLTTPDGTAALLGETAALNYTVPGLKLLQPGDYTITIKALSGNTELESVNKAFTVTGDFVFAVRDDSTGIVVVKYNGTASTLTVPNTVAGLPVVEIGAQAFEGNTKLKSVTLPATIEIIGRRAFAECKNLLEVK